jgi:hypothetical protein
MVRVLQRAAASNCDESGVAIFGKNHGCTCPSASAQRCTWAAVCPGA